MTLYTKLRSYLLVSGVILFSSLLLWLPFLIRANDWFGLKIFDSNMQYVYRNFDGPLYIIAAKTLYKPEGIKQIGLELPLKAEYFAAHLPGYPLLIRLFGPWTGYLKAQIIVNLISTIILACFFFYFVTKFKLTKHPLLLTTVFLFLPRFYVVRSIGAPESLFMLFTLLSLFFFERKSYLIAGIWGGLSIITKSPGILLVPAYALTLVHEYVQTHRVNWKALLGILFIPIGLLLVFLFYWLQYGDFFAYFHAGDNIHLVTPFSVFNYETTWVRTAWLEDVVFYFFMYALSLFFLRDLKYKSLYYYALVFFIPILLIQHRDIARYSLPLWPLACIAFEKVFTSRRFLLALVIVLPGIYLYAVNFLLFNVMPVANWKPFL